MSSLDKIDRDLLYLLAAAKASQPQTTWSLATRANKGSRSSIKKNRTEGIYRYHLNTLVEKGIVVKHMVKKGSAEYARYTLNPKKILCVDGGLILLSNPILIFECKYSPDKCPSHCHPRFYRPNGHTTVKGSKCRLLEEAPKSIQDAVCQELDRPD